LAVAAAVVVALAVGLPVLARPGGAGTGLSALGRPATGAPAAANHSLYVVAPSAKTAGKGVPAGGSPVAGPETPTPVTVTLGPTSTHRVAKPPSNATFSVSGTVPGPQLVVSGLDPASGPAAGGNWALLTGSGLSRATTVDFGDVPARVFEVLSPLEVRVLVPAHQPGSVAVVARAAGQGSAGQGSAGQGSEGRVEEARYSFAATG